MARVTNIQGETQSHLWGKRRGWLALCSKVQPDIVKTIRLALAQCAGQGRRLGCWSQTLTGRRARTWCYQWGLWPWGGDCTLLNWRAGKDSQHIVQAPQALAMLSYTSISEHDRDPVLYKHVLTVLVLAAHTTHFLPQSTSPDPRNLCHP